MEFKCYGCKSKLSIREIRNQLPIDIIISGKLKCALKSNDKFKNLLNNLNMNCKSCYTMEKKK